MNNNKPWVNAIRQGDFAQAEEDLSNAAAQRLLPLVEQRYMQAQLAQEEARIDSRVGAVSRYVKTEVMQDLQQAIAQGKVQSPSDLIARYDHSMQTRVAEFKNRFRETVDPANPYNPSDDSVHEYVQSRKAESARLREEGKRISQTPTK